jgi:hypothetical protein
MGSENFDNSVVALNLTPMAGNGSKDEMSTQIEIEERGLLRARKSLLGKRSLAYGWTSNLIGMETVP